MKMNTGSATSFTDLETLARSRELNTSELFTPNDFYGQASTLKAYCDIPARYAIKASMEHGFAPGIAPWRDITDATLPGIISFSPAREPYIRRVTSKPLEFIGPPIHYARHFLNEDELAREQTHLGRSLLVFPMHSGPHYTAEFNIPRFCETIAELGKDFDSVRVCLYWKDCLIGRQADYARRGFECVTAGHIFDPLFLPRLKSILATAALCFVNSISTVVGYSVYMDIPVLFSDSAFCMAPSNPVYHSLNYNPWHAGDFPKELVELNEAFADFNGEISDRQSSLVRKYWGVDHIKSPQKLRSVFDMFEEMHATHAHN